MDGDRGDILPGALGALPAPQREVLLQLKLLGAATAAELAALLYVTPTAVRHSLRTLTARGLVASRPGRADFAGRPPQSYVLTPEADALFPSVIPQFVVDLVALSSEDERTRLEEIAAHTLETRLTHAVAGKEDAPCPVEALRDLGYMPLVEPVRDGYRIEVVNCPWKGLVELLPVICDIEASGLHRVMRRDFVLKAHRLAGDPTCVWVCRPIEPAPN